MRRTPRRRVRCPDAGALSPDAQLAGITVEGANTLTRSLIQFGQGVTRSHPHLYDIMRTLEAKDQPEAFQRELTNMVRHGVSTSLSSMGAPRGRLARRPGRSWPHVCSRHPAPVSKPAGRAAASSLSALTAPSPRLGRGNAPFEATVDSAAVAHYEAQLNRLAATFAATTDLSLTLGGALKREEMISGRLADALSGLFLGYATLWWCSAPQRKSSPGMGTLMHYCLRALLADTQAALDGVRANFPVAAIRPIMSLVSAAPLGATYCAPDDKLVAATAGLLTRDTGVWREFQNDVFFPADAKARLTMLRDWMPRAVEADALARTLKREKREATAEESAFLDSVAAARDAIVQVDVFDELGEAARDAKHVRPALRPYTPVATVEAILQAQGAAGKQAASAAAA